MVKTLSGIPIVVNANLPPDTAVMVSGSDVVFLTNISDPEKDHHGGCEICGDPAAEARNEDGTDFWCWACYAEQRPEEAYQ